MFWKKKPPTDMKLFSYDSECRREYARVQPLETEPLSAVIGGKKAAVVDIGAGGLAFECGGFNSGDRLDVVIELPGEKGVAGIIEILDSDESGGCHARFVQISEDMVELIHRYVLDVQKKRARSKSKSAL